jgi:hypothetical protein
MSAVGSGPGGWKQDEKEYRYDEVVSQKQSARAQLKLTRITMVTTLVAILTAFFAVFQSQESLHVAEQGIERQADENRLNTAVTAIAGQTPAERLAGVELLWRHVKERLMAAERTPLGSWDRQDVRGLYTSALIILTGFLPRVEHPANKACPVVKSLDVVYAADEVKQLLDERAQFMALMPGGPRPSVDISYAALCGQSWSGVRFDGLNAAYLMGIDLRGSNLKGSQWGNANLAKAKLQCANLSGAHLGSANLTGADLRGAIVAGAQLPNNLQAQQTVGTVRVAKEKWDPLKCLTDGYKGA